MGFARTPISETPSCHAASPPDVTTACLLLDASSASGEMPRLSKDAQTSPLAQMLHPGGGRQEGGDATTSQEELAWMPKWGVGSYSPATVAAISGLHRTALDKSLGSHLRIQPVDNEKYLKS